ncbi:MAG: GTPase Era [Firmicutes bacterium]|nr:GTPase Era [Bacillota bacterium]
MIDIYTKNHKALLKKVLKACYQHFSYNEKDYDTEVDFLTPKEIKDLNKDSRGKDEITDVLSFPALNYSEESGDLPQFDKNPETNAKILGEIYICLKRAEEQANEYGHSLEREIAFLAVHGFLHLLGYEHENEEDLQEMELIGEEILEKAGLSVSAHSAQRTAHNEGNIINNSNPAPCNLQPATSKESAPAPCPLPPATSFKAGNVSILGLPNSGKSTLINALVGEKVAIVSYKPQTTRNAILGVMSLENAEVRFIDTPGLHAPQSLLGKFMMRSATSAVEDADIIVYVIDSEKGFTQQDNKNLSKFLSREEAVIVAVNKTDSVEKEKVVKILTELNAIPKIASVVPLSALKKRHLEPLKDEILKRLPVGERLFDEDTYTDRSMRFTASEIIREKCLKLLAHEVPFGMGVLINEYEILENGVISINADIIVQKPNHKPIVLGKNGDLIKKIATYSRQDLETIAGGKVFLTLFVKVREDWRDSEQFLRELGYSDTDN